MFVYWAGQTQASSGPEGDSGVKAVLPAGLAGIGVALF